MTTHGVGGSSNGSRRRLGRARSLGVSRLLLPSPFRPGDCHEPFRAPGSPPPTPNTSRLFYMTAGNMQGGDKHKMGIGATMLTKAEFLFLEMVPVPEMRR